MKKTKRTTKIKKIIKQKRKAVSRVSRVKETKQAKETAGELSLPILNMKGQSIGHMQLDKQVFDGTVNKPLLYQVVNMYLANKRLGCASTKERGAVRGGGRKPWRQKGTGRARAGSSRSPLWRGGGVVFGPHPRDYSYSLPAKLRRLAIKSSLNAKYDGNEILILDDLILEEPKTKKMYEILINLKVNNNSSLIVLNQHNPILARASRNIPNIKLQQTADLNAYDILRYDKLVMTKQACSDLQKVLAEC